ncbi:MAG: 50S ribosomal protein L22 [Bacteroidales bacterium]|nr:50S ribosomal protein L22 [Bacteroidales bacterium]
MGSRKHISAERRKEEKKSLAFARLGNVPTSPRKMRLVADLVRNMDIEHALHVLKTNPKSPALRLHKLLLSAIANWQIKNDGVRIEDSHLYIKTIQVDGGAVLKRIRPAPQGRAHRIRKRSNHVTIMLEGRDKQVVAETSTEITKE